MRKILSFLTFFFLSIFAFTVTTERCSAATILTASPNTSIQPGQTQQITFTLEIDGVLTGGEVIDTSIISGGGTLSWVSCTTSILPMDLGTCSVNYTAPLFETTAQIEGFKSTVTTATAVAQIDVVNCLPGYNISFNQPSYIEGDNMIISATSPSTDITVCVYDNFNNIIAEGSANGNIGIVQSADYQGDWNAVLRNGILDTDPANFDCPLALDTTDPINSCISTATVNTLAVTGIQCDPTINEVINLATGAETCDSICGTTSGSTCNWNCKTGTTMTCATKAEACACAATSTTTSTGATCTVQANTAGIIPCDRKFDDPATTWNECNKCTPCSLILVFQLLMELLLKLSVFLAVISLTLGGVIYITAGGQSSGFTIAKTIIKYTLIGFIVIFSAWAIVNTILSTLGYINPLGGSWYAIC